MLGFKLVSEKVNSRLVSHLSLLEVSIRDFDTQEGRWLPLVVHVLLNLVKVVLDDLLWVCLQDIHDAENCSIRDLLIEIPNKNIKLIDTLFSAQRYDPAAVTYNLAFSSVR